MCSYDRSARFVLPRQSTLPKVCPNTYYLPDQISTGLAGYAPFLSYAGRSDDAARKKDSGLPSAADYYPLPTGPRVQGGKAMWNTEERFSQVVEVEGPGPGEYDLRHPNEIAEEMRKEKAGKQSPQVCHCRVRFSIGESPPSIPHRSHRHGYLINRRGALWALPPSFHDLSLGPAFYDSGKALHENCNRAKGGQWSRSTSKREFGSVQDGPGPGAYELPSCLPVPSPSQVRDNLVRFHKRQCSKLPRLAEIVETHALREDLPGPGRYNVPYVPEEKIGKKIHCGFLSSDQRFREQRDLGPSPWDHDVKGTFGRPKPGSVKNSGFLTDADRFQKPSREERPGPADYSIAPPAKRPSRHGIRVVGFDSCAERDLNFAPKDAASVPACNVYYPKDVTCSQEPCSCSAVFKSRTARMKTSSDDGMPNCASYTVDAATRRLHEKRSFRRPCECVGASFDTGEPRFRPVRDVVASIRDSSQPGPAEYNVLQAAYLGRKNVTGYWERTPRFGLAGNSELPGPATYELHPRVIEPSCRYTFNSTLGPPRAPEPRLYHERPKKLHWFSRQRPGWPPEIDIVLPEDKD